MAGKELVVDDEYLKEIGKYILSQGAFLDKYVNVYVTILTQLKNTGIVDGNTAEAFNRYIKNAEGLKGKIYSVSKNVYKLSNSYVTAIDKVDQFLF